MALYAFIVLAVIWLYECLDSKHIARLSRLYKPYALANNPTYTPEKDVSIIVPTLDPPPTFAYCLRRWMQNKPLEIIVVTIPIHFHQVLQIVDDTCVEYGLDRFKIKVIASDIPGARAQLTAGIKRAKGRIIARVDDHIYWRKNFLKYMLAAFEDPKVGAAAPPVRVYIPPSRCNSHTITPYEVAARRLIPYSSPIGTKAAAYHAAYNWCWIIGGYSGLYRASILRNPAFIKGYNSDSWRGKHLDAGDDTYLSRWLLRHDWIIATQSCEETVVWRTGKRTKAFFHQILRWERSSVQSFWRCFWEVPQIYHNHHILRKTIERLLLTQLAPLRALLLPIALHYNPILTSILVCIHLYQLAPGYIAFFEQNPYMRRYWWAAVLVDFRFIVLGPWALATLGDDTWVRGEGKWAGAESMDGKDGEGEVNGSVN